ncbi:MAG: ATP-binding cassette domain-containing protein [Clostridiales bacterium]|nr:ATP-binding cassette domain-containing protein [Clostridiales bacterium]
MLKIKELSKSFNKNTENEIRIFDEFNLSIDKNKCTAIIGPNGCGKSTLLNLNAGNTALDQGEILLNGRNITKLNEEDRAVYLGRVHQDPSKGVSPSLTILENMSLADKKGDRFSLNGLIKKNNAKRYIALLKELDLGLEKKLDTKVKFLSGGQRQCLSLIMAAMKHPDLLLLDEHTAALDPKTSNLIMHKTKELIEKYAITTMMVSHNMRDAIKFSDRIVMLDKGIVVLDKLSTDVTEEELIRIYKEKLTGNVA